jgi:LAS superfamily LD-carboxypeptidase LdcB
MNRKEFIKNSMIIGTGFSVLPAFSMNSFQNKYTRSQLIGLGNQNIIGDSYTSKMHWETAIALAKMKTAASIESIQIEVVSAYRSFQRQKEIYESKYRRFMDLGLSPMDAINKIVEFSTIPGTSRHHWGTDIDIIDSNTPQPDNVLQANHFHGKGPYNKLKEWLDEYSESFGFYEVYTDNPNRKGFEYEPWHFSFAPVSIPMLKAFIELDLKTVLQEEKIMGNEHFTDGFISKYRKENILDINPDLL